MYSKLQIQDETLKKQGVSINAQGIFTGTVDSWIVGTPVGSSTLTAEAGLAIKLLAEKTAVNNSMAIKTSFYITPQNYKKIRIINIIQFENCNFDTINCEADFGLFNTGNTNFIQVLLHDRNLRTRVNGVTSTLRYTRQPTNPVKPRTFEMVWDVVNGWIDVYDNNIFLYRFSGSDVPDKTASYQFLQKVVTKDTLSDKIMRIRKLSIELEV